MEKGKISHYRDLIFSSERFTIAKDDELSAGWSKYPWLHRPFSISFAEKDKTDKTGSKICWSLSR